MENRITKVELPGAPPTVAGTYEYDGEGRRVRKTAGTTTVFVYDAMGQLMQEVGGATEAAGRSYLFQDHLGSTRLRVDSNGTRLGWWDYTPFGEVVPGSLGNRSGVAGGAYEGPRPSPMFTGKERDAETGLDYFGARYMSAAQGRFTSPDPNSAGASLFDPQSWNAYSYVNNRPLSHIDPDGDVPIPVITGGIGAGVGALVGGGFEAWKQYAQDGRVTNWGKIGTAAGGGFISGGLAGLTLGFGAAAGAAATTAEVVAVNASSNVIGGYAQRRADEALGYEASVDNAKELANIALGATTGAAFAWAGGKVANKLFPIPNVQKEIAALRFAHRRSTRTSRIQAAQRRAEVQALSNSVAGGVTGGVPTEGSKWLWQWFTASSSQKEKKKEPIGRVCYEGGSCEVVQ